MQDRPDVAEEALAAGVALGWGLDVAAVRFLPVGLDVAWAYEVRTGAGERFFLKVRNGEPALAAIQVPCYLNRCGVPQPVPPISTVDGRPWQEVWAYCLVLYPFVGGDPLWDKGLTDEQWVGFGEFLAALHRVEVPPELAALMPVETFDSPAPAEVSSMMEASVGHSGPQLADFWRAHGAGLGRLIEATERLAPVIRAQNPPLVLCHADIHANNMIADGGGAWRVVDWEAPIRAPRERDLMFVLGGPFSDLPITDHQESLFWQGYGQFEVNAEMIAYYCCERVVDDIRWFVRTAVDKRTGEATRRESLHWMWAIFGPSGTAQGAHGKLALIG